MSNRIDKIKNYNQFILAIAGTIGLIFIIWLALYAVWEMTDSWRTGNDDIGILATEQTDILQKENLRKQIISFNRIQIIDSASQTYILPVTQANLVNAEHNEESLGLLNVHSSKTIGRSYERYSRNIYNNLVLYDGLNEKSEVIFKSRISIEDFIQHEQGSTKYIIIPACNRDSNKDGVLNEADLQELFVYDIQNKKLHKIQSEENYTTLSAYQPEKSNDLIVHFGIDRNNNGKFERSSEPMVFYKVDFQTMSLTEFVNNDQISVLQNLLEGKE